jgi:predicted nucleic acid-binding protein
VARFFWDTNHYIYLLEGDPIFQSAVVRLRQQMLLRKDDLITSALTLGEIQVKALNESRPQDAADLKRRVSGSSQIVPFDESTADAFAYIRSVTKIKGADAIQLACAMTADVDFFITNDAQLQKQRLPGIGQITSAQLLPTL